MALINDHAESQLFLELLRSYVLDPGETAVDVAAKERTELLAEREAFERFSERMATLNPAPTESDSRVRTHNSDTVTAKLRAAYRETVMAVDHYDVVYDEPLRAHAVAELGPDAGVVFCPETGVTYTPVMKQLVLDRTSQRIEERCVVSENVSREIESLEASQDRLRALVRGLTSTVVPEWHRDNFDTELENVVTERQRSFTSRPGSQDGYDLCEYLYSEQPWSYPILTATARLREATIG